MNSPNIITKVDALLILISSLSVTEKKEFVHRLIDIKDKFRIKVVKSKGYNVGANLSRFDITSTKELFVGNILLGCKFAIKVMRINLNGTYAVALVCNNASDFILKSEIDKTLIYTY